MTTLDYIGELELLLEALSELTQQVIDLTCYPGQEAKGNALDTARVAVEEKLKATLKNMETFVRYGEKEGATA